MMMSTTSDGEGGAHKMENVCVWPPETPLVRIQSFIFHHRRWGGGARRAWKPYDVPLAVIDGRLCGELCYVMLCQVVRWKS
jgi:hypothetical protein